MRVLIICNKRYVDANTAPHYLSEIGSLKNQSQSASSRFHLIDVHHFPITRKARIWLRMWVWTLRIASGQRASKASSLPLLKANNIREQKRFPYGQQLINENISVSICPAGFSHDCWNRTAVSTPKCSIECGEGAKRFMPIIYTIPSFRWSSQWQLFSSAILPLRP